MTGQLGPPEDDAAREVHHTYPGPSVEGLAVTHTQHRKGTTAGRQHRDGAAISAQSVSWWSVHEHVAPLLEAVGAWPMAGTPAWCELADDDPVKLAALLDASRHWALHLEINQQAHAEASHDISAAADWRSIAGQTRRRREVYIPREVVA
jgi:hypothetical protein